MKKIIIITIAFILICVTPLLIYHFSTLPPKETNGTIVGEVVAADRDYVLYVKPVADNGTKQLLEFRLANNTKLESFSNISDLTAGTVVEINYTSVKAKNIAPTITADSIRIVAPSSSSSEWPKLVLNEDFSWDYIDIASRSKGEVIYVAKLSSPIEGYLVYINDSDLRFKSYFIRNDNIFLTDEIKALLEQKATGYIVEAEGLNGELFIDSAIRPTFSIELIKN